MQNIVPGSLAVPQAGQGRPSGWPQEPQNFASGRFSLLQFGQTINS